MIGSLMVYGVAVGLALTVVGVMLEHVAALGGFPRRGVWAWMLGAMVLLICALPLRARPPIPVTESSFTAAGQVGELPPGTAGVERPSWLVAVRQRVGAGLDGAVASVARVDVISRWIWMSASIAMLVAYALGRWTLSRRRRQWREEYVQGVPVLIAPDDGPAVIGVVTPKIVLPAWALGLKPQAIDLMIRHEHEHDLARDPLLIHLAGLALLMMPWNPAAWWMVSRLRLAVELDCDARVLRTIEADRDAVSSTVSVYGELLLAVAERRSPRRALVAPALIEHASTLRRRISAMYPRPIRLRLLRATASSGAALGVFAFTLALPAPRLLAHTSTITTGAVRAVPAPAAVPTVVSPNPRRTAVAHVPRSSALRRSHIIEPREQQVASTPAERTGTTQADPVYEIGNGIASPVLIAKVDATYTRAALAARVMGEVWLAGIVEKNGLLSTLRVTKSLDPTLGLDQAALDAAGKWRFKPGMKDGEPVRVAVQLILEFRLDSLPYQEGSPGLVDPVVKSHPDPTYTSDAMRAKIQGVVKVAAVVEADGTVSRVRILESLDQTFGLDDAALKAAKQWTFEPGTLDGKPVPVSVTLTLEFRLH